MALLSVNEITRESKEYRSQLLIDKIFLVGGKTNNFMTEGGLFDATGIDIQGTRYMYSPQYSNEKFTKELADKILGLRGQRNVTLDLIGMYAGQERTSTVPITKVEKSEEFGGQPAGGARENKGLKFERDLTEQLSNVLTGADVKGPYAEAARKIIDLCCEQIGSPAVAVEQTGGSNESRPFGYSGGKIVVMPPRHEDHGPKLRDIKITHKNGKESNLSLKFGGTLTFVNTGVKGRGKAFPEDEIKKGAITNDMGVALLKALGINNANFCNVFNSYGTGKKAVEKNKVDVSKDVNRQQLKALMQTALGSNYWMIHGKENGTVDVWFMDPSKSEAMATISGSFELFYGGADGKAKRIDMKFSNNYFDFKLNIRNKQSGVYPSHFMLDYHSKKALNKMTFK